MYDKRSKIKKDAQLKAVFFSRKYKHEVTLIDFEKNPTSMFIDFLDFFQPFTPHLLQLCTKAVTYDKRPKVKRDTHWKQVFSLEL